MTRNLMAASAALTLLFLAAPAPAAPASAATDARAWSSSARACCPYQWRLDGLPNVSRSTGTTASTTRASMGVVAL